VTRRQLVRVAGASALSAALLGRTARDRPNLVLVIVDTLRADHVGAYGGRANTPNIDLLASEGLRFTQVFPEAMPTIAARNSIMRGRRVFPFRHWHDWPGLPPRPSWFPFGDLDATFTTALRRSGYWTAYFTDTPHLLHAGVFRAFRHSFDRFVRFEGQLGAGQAQGTASEAEARRWLITELRRQPYLRRMRGHLPHARRYWEDDSRSWAARLFLSAARTLDVAARHEPFAMVLDTFEPHEPWTPPRRYIEMYGDPDYGGPEPALARYMRVRDWLGDERAGPVLRRMRDLYAAEVTMTDRWLGAFLERLEDRGLRKRTVVVLVSDHGFLLGEHGWTAKIASELYPELTHVPLVICDPRHRGARESDYFASTHDIGPTLLSLARVREPAPMNGVDLSPALEGRRLPDRRLAYGGINNHFFARSPRWTVMADNRGRNMRLYNRSTDPLERVNVITRHPDLAARLHRAVVRRTGRALPYYEGVR
jgi:arylsulfatase A-like enzyme